MLREVHRLAAATTATAANDDTRLRTLRPQYRPERPGHEKWRDVCECEGARGEYLPGSAIVAQQCGEGVAIQPGVLDRRREHGSFTFALRGMTFQLLYGAHRIQGFVEAPCRAVASPQVAATQRYLERRYFFELTEIAQTLCRGTAEQGHGLSRPSPEGSVPVLAGEDQIEHGTRACAPFLFGHWPWHKKRGRASSSPSIQPRGPQLV